MVASPIDMVHYTEAVGRSPVEGQKMPNLGRTGSAMKTMPVPDPSTL